MGTKKHIRNILIPRWALIAFLLSISCFSSASPIVIYQLNITLDGTSRHQYTDWGNVDFTYTGRSDIWYFNLTVDDAWTVQNIPVLSPNGVGATYTQTYAFNIGNYGQPISSAQYGYDFSALPLPSKPLMTDLINIEVREIAAYSGVRELPAIPPLPRSTSLVGGTVADPRKHVQPKFPNQECGVGECAPTAASNSLQWLKSQKGLQVKDSDISIAAMKTAMHWDPTGVWIDHDNTRPSGQSKNAWWEDKDAYLRSKNINVETKLISNIDDIIREVIAGEDIELQGDWHTAAITGIAKLKNGKYSIDVTHDTKQGQVGGTLTETIIYDPTSRRFAGSPGFFNGSGFHYAVSESIPEPTTLTLLCIGGLGLAFRRRHIA